MEIDVSAKLLEEIAQTANNWREIGESLRNHGVNSQDHPSWHYVYAFEYMHVEETNKEYYDRYGPFAPWIEMQEGVFPPPLDKIDDETLLEWEKTLERVKHPVLCSRLADLLWVRKWGKRPDLLARKAINLYIEISGGDWIELERAYCLIRALDIAKEINDAEAKSLLIPILIDACYQELRSSDQKPGVSLRLIEALMKLPRTEIPDAVDALLDLAFHTYEKDAWIVENVIELMIRRANAEKQKELQIYQISRWVEEAEKGEKGIIQLHHLNHALELARNNGFQDVADDIRRRIQSVPEEDLDLKSISVKIEIPTEEVEKFLNWFVDERGWEDSFVRFGLYGPPSGDYRNNIEEIEKHIQEFPLQFLVTRAVYDENNVPIKFARNIDENKAIELANQETMRIKIFGFSATEILDRIKQSHGVPPISELSEFFATPIISADIAINLAKAFDWYYKGEYDVAAHIIIPRIETIFRVLARKLGLPIIREPIGNVPGGVIPLGSIFPMLQDRIDESWRRYFYNLLVNPIGVNLRNRICHGLVPVVEKEDSALLLHLACHLRLVIVAAPTENDESN